MAKKKYTNNKMSPEEYQKMKKAKENKKKTEEEVYYLESKGKLTKISKSFIKEAERNIILFCILLVEIFLIILSSIKLA